MKIKFIVIFTLLGINILIHAFVPRFGFTLRNGNHINPYKYQEQRKGSPNYDVYESTDSVLSIAYQNRFSNTLEVQFDNSERYTITIRIDGASDTVPQPEKLSVLDFLESDIIWKDLNGIFYYRYIFVVGAMVAYTLCFIKIKPEFSIVKRTLFYSAGIALFIFAAMVSFRIIL